MLTARLDSCMAELNVSLFEEPMSSFRDPPPHRAAAHMTVIPTLSLRMTTGIRSKQ